MASSSTASKSRSLTCAISRIFASRSGSAWLVNVSRAVICALQDCRRSAIRRFRVRVYTRLASRLKTRIGVSPPLAPLFPPRARRSAKITPTSVGLSGGGASMNNSEYDIAVIGGGIIGLATAMRLSQEFPRYRVAVLEKEREVALHQTGHNSGVIHAGIYYAPGSQKANFCSTGGALLRQFCGRARHRVRYVRQAHRGHRRRRGAAPGGPLPPRHRERRPGAADGRPGAPARDRAPTRRESRPSSRPTRASSTTPGSPRPTP